MKKILFVCVGNTCRSQMAEGFARALCENRCEVRSAGTSAMGVVNAQTIEAMKEAGVDISGQTSKQFAVEMLKWADVVVTMGCTPAEKLCPSWYKGKKIDWQIADPLGRPWGIMQQVRDTIEEKVRGLLDED